MREDARYIWYDSTGEGLNRYGLFRRTFDLGIAPRGTMHLFADQRYRLLVNGQVVGHGPARFKLIAPEYDTYELTPWLRVGLNTVAVMVCAYGTKVFFADDSIGALIAWGEVADASGTGHDLSTGSEWKAVRSAGHRETENKMSFAIGLPEILDARETPSGWAGPEFDDSQWPAAVLLDDQARWGALTPRSIPALDETVVRPERFLGTWRIGGKSRISDDVYGDQWHDRAVKFPGADALPLTDLSGEHVSLVFDFGTEVLGRPIVEIEAPAGTAVDSLYTEQLDPSGRPVHGVQGTRMAERYICREGRQTWQAMHPRGMRYLEVVLRGQLEDVTVHAVSLTRANYAVKNVGEFSCSDPVFNDVWQLCRRTQHACMEDAFLDCPWRERGHYTGDLLVQYITNLALYGDHALMRRCIWLFSLTQDESGLLAPCTHALNPSRHPDYSAIAVQALYVYWSRSGDSAFVEELTPRLHRLMQGLRNIQVADTHLVDGTGRAPYIDLAHFDREGISCALNCFMQRAFHDAARLMAVLGDAANEAVYATEADAIAEAIRQGYWRAEHAAFVDRLAVDVPGSEPSVHANTLPVLYGIADLEQTAAALDFVSKAVAHNYRLPAPTENRHCNVTSYFSSYVLPVLCSHDRGHESEAFIRTNWKRYLDADAATCWEYFVHGWSLCHAWSTSPVHYFAEQVLGVTFPEPGNPNVVRIDPHPGTLQWAEGAYPHPCGPIRVSWRIVDGEMNIEKQIPDGVTVVDG